MSICVDILGCGSATPSLRHMPACQVLEHNGKLFMIDCGEGAQLSLRRHGIKMARLRHIFISHLHGDHVLGLPGLLSTLSLNDTTGEVHVYMLPEGIEVIQRIIEVFSHTPTYTLVFHPLKMEREVIYESKGLTVETFPLKHLVPAVGFIFREKPRPRSLIADMVEYHNVPVSQRAAIKGGADFVTPEGVVVPNSHLTRDPEPPASYAYASDTMKSRAVVEAVKGVDVLYHEATYADDKASKAAERGHSTARQAAIVAREAGVKELIIGHFSKAYNGQEDTLLAQAREEFPNTELADEGKKFCVR